MDLNLESETADILNSLGSEKRLKTFACLSNGMSRAEIAEQLEVTSAALQPYINDFKEHGLVTVKGKDTEVTEFGNQVLNQVQHINDAVVREQLEEKAASMKQAGLSYEDIFQALLEQEYDQTEVLQSVIAISDSPDVDQAELEDVISGLTEDIEETEAESR